MIQDIQIKNYKSIPSLDLELGQVNILIGENGCGKSNILEAIALGCAASEKKLDNEFPVFQDFFSQQAGFLRTSSLCARL